MHGPDTRTQEFSFKVQVPGKDGAAKMFTFGRTEMDLATFATAERGAPVAKIVPIVFKVGPPLEGRSRRHRGDCNAHGELQRHAWHAQQHAYSVDDK